MTMTRQIASARLARQVPEAEQAIDQALQATTAVLQTMLSARIEADVPPHTGQLALSKLMQSQQALIAASNDFMRVHRELAAIGQELMAADYGDCPPATGALENPAKQAA